MPVLHDYFCAQCEAMEFDRWEPPQCCGASMRVAFTTLHTTEWGGPRQLTHLRDEPFSSRSELESYCKANGLRQAPSADKHGGARNEDHLNLGKKYSYRGAPRS